MGFNSGFEGLRSENFANIWSIISFEGWLFFSSLASFMFFVPCIVIQSYNVDCQNGRACSVPNTLLHLQDRFYRCKTMHLWIRVYHTCRYIGLTFMGPCIANTFQYISNKMQLYTVYLYLETAPHVSGVTSTHHQERKQLYLQHLVFCHTVTATYHYSGR